MWRSIRQEMRATAAPSPTAKPDGRVPAPNVSCVCRMPENGTATSQNLLRNENKQTNKPTKNAPGRFIFSPSPFKSVHVWQLLWGTNVVSTPPCGCGDNSLGLGPPWLRGPKIQKVKKAPVTTSPSRRHLQTLCQSLSRQGTRQTFRATSTPEGIVLC